MFSMARETLGFRRTSFGSRFIVTYANIITSILSNALCQRIFNPVWNALLPLNKVQSIASATDFSPVIFSAQNHLTSELLRFL